MANQIPRRGFLTNTLAAGAVVASPSLATAALGSSNADREYYEWRTYRTANADKLAVVKNYIEKALVPALGRMGIDRIGGFEPEANADESISVLIPHKTLDTVGHFNDHLADDSAYQDAAKEYFAAPLKDPSFVRIENRLMRAFKGMPVIELPPQTAKKEARVFEIRIYESHTEHAARLKVEMFDEGEIQIMRDVKLAPVFYGETLVSNDVPNLTYMLSGESKEAHKQHFQDFLKHPEWDRMKRLERYKGTVSKITSLFFTPTEWSQI
ncbi:MAG: NIPSNAP family protein [Planctomycetaceae bacterium]